MVTRTQNENENFQARPRVTEMDVLSDAVRGKRKEKGIRSAKVKNSVKKRQEAGSPTVCSTCTRMGIIGWESMEREERK